MRGVVIWSALLLHKQEEWENEREREIDGEGWIIHVCFGKEDSHSVGVDEAPVSCSDSPDPPGKK